MANEATKRALKHIDDYLREGLIDGDIYKRACNVVRQLFTSTTVYATVAPIDDGDISFYWRAGDRSISIDLYGEGGFWASARVGSENVHDMWESEHNDVMPLELIDHLRDFSDHVQRVNPGWREQQL